MAECDKVASGVVRTSAILIAAGNQKLEVYRSVDEVPTPMRRLLAKSTEGANSGTIWIADRRGLEQIGRFVTPSPGAEPGHSSFALVWLWVVSILLVGVFFTMLTSRL